MKEKEFMELLNTLANDVTERFEGKDRNSLFVRYYAAGRFHFIITMRYDYSRNEYRIEITGDTIFKISRTRVAFSEYISSLFVEIPKLIVSIIREIDFV